MANDSYRFSEGTKERIKEVQVHIQNVLDLPEPPTEQFTISIIVSLGLGIITATKNSGVPMQYSHPKNFRDFVSLMYQIYLSRP